MLTSPREPEEPAWRSMPTPSSIAPRSPTKSMLPSGGDQFSPKDTPGSDQTDSDINPAGVNWGFSDSFDISYNVLSVTAWDAGIDRF
jgi:hypothetical protein